MSSQTRPHFPRAPKNLPLSSAVRAKQVLGPRGARLTFPLLKTRPPTSYRHPHSGLRALGASDSGLRTVASLLLGRGRSQKVLRENQEELKVEARPGRMGRRDAALTHPLRLSGQLRVSATRRVVLLPVTPAGRVSASIHQSALGRGRRPAASARGDASSAPGSATPRPRGGEGRGKGLPRPRIHTLLSSLSGKWEV